MMDDPFRFHVLLKVFQEKVQDPLFNATRTSGDKEVSMVLGKVHA